MMVRLLLDRGAQIDAKTKVIHANPSHTFLPPDVRISVSYAVQEKLLHLGLYPS